MISSWVAVSGNRYLTSLTNCHLAANFGKITVPSPEAFVPGQSPPVWAPSPKISGIEPFKLGLAGEYGKSSVLGTLKERDRSRLKKPLHLFVMLTIWGAKWPRIFSEIYRSESQRFDGQGNKVATLVSQNVWLVKLGFQLEAFAPNFILPVQPAATERTWL